MSPSSGALQATRRCHSSSGSGGSECLGTAACPFYSSRRWRMRVRGGGKQVRAGTQRLRSALITVAAQWGPQPPTTGSYRFLIPSVQSVKFGARY